MLKAKAKTTTVGLDEEKLFSSMEAKKLFCDTGEDENHTSEAVDTAWLGDEEVLSPQIQSEMFIPFLMP